MYFYLVFFLSDLTDITCILNTFTGTFDIDSESDTKIIENHRKDTFSMIYIYWYFTGFYRYFKMANGLVSIRVF